MVSVSVGIGVVGICYLLSSGNKGMMDYKERLPIVRRKCAILDPVIIVQTGESQFCEIYTVKVHFIFSFQIIMIFLCPKSGPRILTLYYPLLNGLEVLYNRLAEACRDVTI